MLYLIFTFTFKLLAIITGFVLIRFVLTTNFLVERAFSEVFLHSALSFIPELIPDNLRVT